MVPLPKLDIHPEPSSWETGLVDKKMCPSTVEACVKAVEPLEKEYLATLAESWRTSVLTNGKKAAQPNVELLEKISKLYATAIALNTENKKLKGGALDETLHIQLGLWQEEVVCCKNTFPLPELGKKTKVNNNAEANASFMSDEIDGLLMGLGVTKNASEATKIKAMEEEFHRLLAAGLSDQAAEVQGLHQWKVQQVNASSGAADWQAGGNGKQSRGEGGIATALEKYEHAVGINPNNSDANYHLGRIHIQLGNFEKAQLHLEHALANKPIFPFASFLLVSTSFVLYLTGKQKMLNTIQGLSIVSPKLPKLELIPHALKLLEDPISDFHTSLWLAFRATATNQPFQTQSTTKLCETILDPTNTHFHNAHIGLSKSYLLTINPLKSIHPITLLLSILPQTLQTLPPKSKAFQTTSLNLCQARKHLLHLLPLIPHQESTTTTLDALNQSTILSTTLTVTSSTSSQETTPHPETLTSIEQISQSIVFRTSNNPAFVSQLGKAQLDQLDANPAFSKDLKKLQNAIECFEVADILEVSAGSGAIPERALTPIQGQDWFVALKKEVDLWAVASKPKEVPKAAAATKGAAGKKGAAAPAVKGTASKSAVAAKPAPAAKAPQAKPATVKGGPVPKTQGKDAVEKTSRPASSSKVGVKKGSTATLGEKKPTPKGSKSNLTAPAPPSVIPNSSTENSTISSFSTFETHIGLARAISKKYGFIEEANAKDAQLQPLLETLSTHYKNAIKIKPSGHDAYIELGSLLERKVSIRAAADLYCLFPFPELRNNNPNQDDLYIFSELGRCFMKEKRYKETLLKDCLVAEGRANGMPSLAKYVDALDKAGESKLLMAVYAGVNRKVVVS
ncbi:UNVERIFIED_CONTAM: hypothetical protein HDU68_004467 [Siphonaria sp. JEL0065]|nr:hypothetical protein HDU68_004467 [Siphonaria sp. JEL0065]